MAKNDIYDILGRVKNIIAREDIALSPVGTILVNYFSLMLLNLYKFAENLPTDNRESLERYLEAHENLPLLVIKTSMPKDEPMSAYEQFTKMEPQFASIEAALTYYIKEYEELGQKYGMGGEDFWWLAEIAPTKWTEDMGKIQTLRRQIGMCHHLINKKKGEE